MSFFKKIDPYIYLVLGLALLAGWWLLRPGYFNMHDDLQMMRQLEMEKCFADLQIPCRWVPDLGYGFGFPLFNYYPPLPYLVGEGIRLLHFSFVTTVKLTFLLSFLISGVAMYIFAREFFGRLGGLLSSAFYIWAPYHSVDIFVRGAMNEAWALCWFPLILWSSYKLITVPRRAFFWTVTLAISLFVLLTSHNLMVMIFSPLFAVWVLIWLVKYKSWRRIPHLAISGIWALGLAAFFTLPAFLEQKYVQVDTLVKGYYEYVAHFANIRQLLTSRFWGYGPSAWADVDDKMAFPVGHIHWILAILVFVLILKALSKRKKLTDASIVVIFFFVVGWFAAFMAHSKSTFIWQHIPPLVFVQFPWRFLTLVIFSFSTVVGALPVLMAERKPHLARWVAGLLVFAVIAWNWEFFRPEHLGPLTDKEKFSAAAWDLQQTAGIYDYLPKTAYTAPKEAQKQIADSVEGKSEIANGAQGTNWARFKIKVESTEAKVRVNVFEFPLWKVFVDGRETNVFIDKKEEWGRMYITVPTGEHQVTAKLYNTPIRTVGNAISAVSWVFLFAVPVWRRKNK